MAYWIGSWLVGPRYYYEGLYSLTLLSAAGIAWLAGWPTQPGENISQHSGWQRFSLPKQFSKLPRFSLSPRIRPLAVTALVALLLAGNLIYYTPLRLNMLFGLYNVQRSCLQPFQTPAAQELTPALIVVHPVRKWIEYGCLLELEDPLLDSPFIFIISRSPEVDNLVAAQFPDRAVYHYYPDTPDRSLYQATPLNIAQAL